jgi:xanthine dehydrogenase YagS FAD-binding subunit
MRPFTLARADSVDSAIHARRSIEAGTDLPPAVPVRSQYVAGGTTLIDLMKLEVMRPAIVTDINALENTSSGRIEYGAHGLRLGALVRMARASEHPAVKENFPVIAQSLQLAASPQVRNMASLGGNVLQRTRCSYFRDISYRACNKRAPGSGCAALQGFNRPHAVLGTSDHCIAAYAGDFAHALIALDATVEVSGAHGSRTIPFGELHRPPGNTPHIETNLEPDDLITVFVVPPLPWARRSLFLKIRDRESYEFALASAAVAVDLDGEKVNDARIALGGVSAVPWRAREAELLLKGKRLDDATLEAAADKAFEPARPMAHNAFKVELGRRTLMRALREASNLEL